MTGAQVTFLGQYRQNERLVDRARRRRQELLGTRTIWIIEAARGEYVAEHRFAEPPRIADLLARLGADSSILAVRVEEQTGRRRDEAAGAAE